MINERTQPMLDQSNGEMSKDVANGLIGNYYTVNVFLPYKDVINEVLTAYLDEHKIVKQNIWDEREATLSQETKGDPVVIAIWDSGIDGAVYGETMWTNKKEKSNQKDDDSNGFVDDVHGIGYDLHANKVTEPLYPIGEVTDRPRLQRLMKGLEDLTSNIDSEESAELKKMLSSLNPEEVKPFIEDISRYGNYAHGTHVAGIAARGNPYARLLAARLTFGHTLIPEEPTIKQAEKDAVMFQEVVEYFKANNVRIVNMSWGGGLAGIESALEQNNAGGSAEERKALARKIFQIATDGLYKAMASAPEILFVTSAGNADNDVTFEEIYPSSYDLPNLMSIGAVDQAGDETDFTSFGKVDCYANGFEVPSFVPGGDEMKMSGTSQASPNVVNLAAKLIAVNSDLTPTQVRELILAGCEEKKAGDRSVRLINPRETMELLYQMK
jgi:subtilisin family serine protease